MSRRIPKVLKNMVWDKYIGKSKGIGACYCCSCDIDSKNFECGHVIAFKNKGPTNLTNLRPICSVCNKSMGTENLIKFKKKYFNTAKYEEAKLYISKIENLLEIIKKNNN